MFMKSRPDRSCTVFVRRGLVCTGLACLLLAHPCFADDWDPPAPNPAKPVNYIEWINKRFGEGIKANAATVYLQCYTNLEPFDSKWNAILTGQPVDDPALSDWLAKNRRALFRFRAAAGMRRCFFRLGFGEELLSPDQREPPSDERMESSLFFIPLPYLSLHRAAVKGLVAQGFQEHRKGRPRRLASNCLAALRSAHHLAAHNPWAIQHLVAVACARLAYAGLLSGLASADDPAAMAAEFAPRLSSNDPELPTLVTVIRIEELIAVDQVQRVFVPVPDGAPGEFTSHIGPLRTYLEATGADVDNKLVLTIANQLAALGFEETTKAARTTFDQIGKWCMAPYHRVMGEADALERSLKDQQNLLVRVFSGSITRLRAVDELNRTVRRGTHLVFYLYAHKAKNGEFPEKLDELQMPNLHRLRVDPFSGKDLVYRKTADGFTLYSVGGNQKDDGGKHSTDWKDEGDYVIWPIQEER